MFGILIQLKTLTDQHEKSVFQIQELKMKISEVVDEQKNEKADKNLKDSQQEVQITNYKIHLTKKKLQITNFKLQIISFKVHFTNYVPTSV